MHRLRKLAGRGDRHWMGAAGVAGIVATIVLAVAVASPVWPQAPAAGAPKFEYEVASFKPNKPGNTTGGFRIGMSYPPDGFSAQNVTIQMLITQAYGIQPYQLSGAPDWLNTERFDVDAKMDAPTAEALQKLTPDERNETRRRMLQALLADRLKLAVRSDTKELPVYNLVIGKNGSKLKESKPDDPATAPAPGGPGAPVPSGGRNAVSFSTGGGGGFRGGPGTVMSVGGRGGEQSISANSVPISTLIRMLGTPLGRPVLDKTGLTGKYDISLKWVPDESQVLTPPGGGPDGAIPPPLSDVSGPSLFTAVQEQLGLKLEAGKGPVLMIVIEHVEKPSEN